MSNYTVQVSWSGKDALNTSDPEKIISGDDLATEFTALQTSVNSKVDTTSGTTTGHTLINPIINTGVTGTAVLDEDNLASDSATKLATQQSIKAYSDTHFADTTVHGTSSAVVGVSDTQALTNKTIVAASNTITTAATGNLTSTDLNAALAELQTDVDTKTTLAAATAATAADVVLTNADVVSTNADVVLTNADVVTTTADKAVTTQDAIDTAADVVLTNADVVLTHADVVSTAADASSASASAVTASAAAAGIYWKEPVVNRSTGNLTLSGEQTIDGILTSTSRILVMNQSSAAENGIYVTASGAWARAVPLNTWDEHVGAVVLVSQGTAYSDQAFMCTVDPGGTLGSTAITWAAFGAVAVNFLVDSFETSTDYTAGTTTTLVITTDAGSEENIRVSFDGVVQHHSTYTYTSGTRTITFDAAIPIGTAEVECQYGSSVGIGTPSDGTVSAAKIASNAVETAKIADNAVTLAKMASGTDGNIISFDSSGNPVAIATGSANQVLTSAGAGQPPTFADAAAAGFTQGTNTTLTATTFVDLTGIPSGAQIVVVSFDEVSFDTDDNVICQLGTSSGFKVTGYTSNAANIKHNTSVPVVDGTKGFITNSWAAYDLLRGAMTFTLKNAANNQWVASHSIAMGGSSGVTVGGGAVELSGNLSQVRITTVTGTANFDYLYGSSVNIMWQ